MSRIKIGVLDEEKEYVKKLSAYLQKYGKEKWELYAFTCIEKLEDGLKQRKLDVLIVTKRELAIRYGNRPDQLLVWLTNKEESEEGLLHVYSMYRFQSAEKIAIYLEELIWKVLVPDRIEKTTIAIYSPVGRCGKTSLALELVNKELQGQWIYMGLEDYSSFRLDDEGEHKGTSDELLYYWKEQNGEQLLPLLEHIGNVVPTGTSFMDGRQIGEEDMMWLKQELQKSDYRGIVFDIGTGVMKDLHMLNYFDYVLVPYVEEENALIKIDNFQLLLGLQGVEEEKVHFLTTDNKMEIIKNLQIR